jgi:hypothetical protein
MFDPMGLTSANKAVDAPPTSTTSGASRLLATKES